MSDRHVSIRVDVLSPHHRRQSVLRIYAHGTVRRHESVGLIQIQQLVEPCHQKRFPIAGLRGQRNLTAGTHRRRIHHQTPEPEGGLAERLRQVWSPGTDAFVRRDVEDGVPRVCFDHRARTIPRPGGARKSRPERRGLLVT